MQFLVQYNFQTTQNQKQLENDPDFTENLVLGVAESRVIGIRTLLPSTLGFGTSFSGIMLHYNRLCGRKRGLE